MTSISRFSKEYVDRFNKYFIKREIDSCWEWTGGVVSSGYGSLKNHIGRYEVAHRQSYRLSIGDIPTGMFVLHKCDNRRCVNPNHLFLGTMKDNTQDMLRKGRGGHHKLDFKKHNNPNNKISEEDAKDIEFLLLLGTYTQKQLASFYGVQRATIKRWTSHLKKSFRKGWIKGVK